MLRLAVYGSLGVLALLALAGGLLVFSGSAVEGQRSEDASSDSPAEPASGVGPRSPPLLRTEMHEATSLLVTLRKAIAQQQADLDVLARRSNSASTSGSVDRARPRIAMAMPPVPSPDTPGQLKSPDDAGKPRVFIHYRAESAPGEAEAINLAHRLESSDFTYAKTRVVAATPAQPAIRYFFPEDAPAASRLAEFLRQNGVVFRVQDMTAFRPLPTRRTLEVWLND